MKKYEFVSNQVFKPADFKRRNVRTCLAETSDETVVGSEAEAFVFSILLI